VKSQTWTFRLGLFDGVAGSPAHPRAFLAERLKPSDGVLGIAQTDWQLTKNCRREAGAWGYTAAQEGLDGRKAHDRGAYVSCEGPLKGLPHLNFWVRGGIADAQAQPIAAYIGGGIAQQGTIPGRPDDRLGFAIGHAIIGRPALNSLGLHHSETSFELTYQMTISRRFVMQPDVDFIRHPAGIGQARDAVGIGLRFVAVGAHPIRMRASDPGDPTIPPDGSPAAPNDDSNE
jgi:porin